MRRPSSFVLACFVLFACASPPESDWLQSLRGREAEPRRLLAVQSEDGFFRARVPAKLRSPIALEDDAYGLELEIGSEAPVECFVYRQGLDPAGSLAAISETTFAAIAETLGEVELRRVDRVDAGAFGESPFLALDWLYRIEGDGGAKVGQVKHLIATKGARSIYCQHNEVGYVQSFYRVAKALVESLQYQEAASASPYFTEISTLAVRGMRVGVEYTTLTRDAEGDTRVDTITSLLMSADGETLQVSDTIGVEFARPDGSLINQVHVETTNGELVTKLKLDPGEDDSWGVSGTFQTKPLSAEIQPRNAPASFLDEALTLRRALAAGGVGATVTLERWVPDADPTRLVDETLSIEKQLDRERFAAKLSMVGIEADLVVDREGSVTSASIDAGPASMSIERVYVGGKL